MKRSHKIPDNKLQDTPAWQQVVLRRRAAPPLRFKGIMLCRHDRKHPVGHIFIELWQKKSGGFVIGLKATSLDDAASLADMDDAMDWLEDRCAQDDLNMVAAHPEDSLLNAPFNVAARQTLRGLAGEAMDAWDQIVAFDEAS